MKSHRNNTIKNNIIGILLISLLAACGHKGPLYLPEDNHNETTNNEYQLH